MFDGLLQNKYLRMLSGIALTFTIIFLTINWDKFFSDWTELSSSERNILLEYKNEVGLDYTYCMKVKASNESYEAIIKKRNLTNIAVIGKQFPKKCKDALWWDISDYVQPQFANGSTKDSLELITRINGFIYFTSEIW